MKRYLKPAVFVICLIPLAMLAWRWQTHQLGINRTETVARFTGDWTIRFLLLSLAITPLRKIRGLSSLIQYRRMLGLFAFFYGSLHFMHYLALDKQWFWTEIWEDFRIRRFFIMGLSAWLLMLPLALTSTNWAIRKMGGKRWQLLHRLAYLSAIAGVIHFHWQNKSLLLDPLVYMVLLGLLLGVRVVFSVQKRAVRKAR